MNDVDQIEEQILRKKLIKETGRLDVPGRPILYSTTDEFLKHFGLQSLSEMPSLEGYLELIQNQDGQDGENEENKE
jgi:segregation and condensation protein B